MIKDDIKVILEKDVYIKDTELDLIADTYGTAGIKEIRRILDYSIQWRDYVIDCLIYNAPILVSEAQKYYVLEYGSRKNSMWRRLKNLKADPEPWYCTLTSPWELNDDL
jgi:hypothetical protein